jgi:RecB family exonuclease
MKDFNGCGRRYHVVKVLQAYPFKDTKATIYGKEVHLALEEYVRDGKPLPEGLTQFKDVADSILAMPGTKYCEHEMAVLEDRTPTDFHDEARWIRGIADVLIVNGTKAKILDYKTGSAKYPDRDQLELMALLVFAHFPEVQIVKGALVFLHHSKLVKGIYKRENIEKMWQRWVDKSDLLDASYANDVWQANPSPLCRFCPVEHCEHWVR